MQVSSSTITVRHSLGSYEVQFNKAHRAWSDLDRSFIITDENVARILELPDTQVHRQLILPAGESTKSLEWFAKIHSWLAHHRCRRNDTIIALGGGVIGDLVGFAAATYMRGVAYIQVPTTLLSQVDSSVGGKVAVDLPEGKNLVGNFYPPQKVIVDVELLSSLPPRQFECGLAEVIKYGWIGDPSLVRELETTPLTPRDPRLKSIIEKCIDQKREVVEADEHETLGIRARLNFGHTVGHAIEKVTNYEVYTHGEAISIGMLAEAKLGELLGSSTSGLANRLETQLKIHGLPTQVQGRLDPDLLMTAMQLDKKNDSSAINFSLVSEVGICSLIKNVPAQQIKEVITQI